MEKNTESFMRSTMKIEVLGDECKKCQILYDNVLQAVAESGEQMEVVRTNDPEVLAVYGVHSLPGLAIDGTLQSTGKFLSVAQIRDLLEREPS
jgi:hypothetical protein